MSEGRSPVRTCGTYGCVLTDLHTGLHAFAAAPGPRSAKKRALTDGSQDDGLDDILQQERNSNVVRGRRRVSMQQQASVCAWQEDGVAAEARADLLLWDPVWQDDRMAHESFGACWREEERLGKRRYHASALKRWYAEETAGHEHNEPLPAPSFIVEDMGSSSSSGCANPALCYRDFVFEATRVPPDEATLGLRVEHYETIRLELLSNVF